MLPVELPNRSGFSIPATVRHVSNFFTASARFEPSRPKRQNYDVFRCSFKMRLTS